MARTGLSKSQIKETRDRLIADGKYPSVDAVRMALGNTGSKSTIHRYLKELEAEAAEPGERREDTARALHALVDQLADKLHAEAEQRIRALRAEYEGLLHAKNGELAVLRAQVEALTDRLDDIEHAGLPARPARSDAGRTDLASSGFGAFGDLLANPRGGRRDASPFSIMVSSGRSELFDVAKLRPAGLKLQ
jgi:hypothetical protein